MTTWTTEQIRDLAPDPASAKAGNGLATLNKWQSVGGTERLFWGACKGSAATPYQTVIDLTGPTFHCSCPSRKFPCKHGLGLFLLSVAQPKLFTDGTPPEWATAWITKRDQKAQAKEQRAAAPIDETTKAKQAADEAKRTANREKRVTEGLDDLSRWLRDLVRQGLATTQSHPASFWDEPAARLVDAQAPGIGRMVQDLKTIPASGDGWPARLLQRLAALHLLIESYRRIASLPAPNQSDIRTLIGWTTKEEDLKTLPAVQDLWFVLGQQLREERLGSFELTWLQSSTGQAGLVQHFSPNQKPERTGLIVGTQWTGECVFYPSAYPLRLSIRSRSMPTPIRANFPTGQPTIAAALDHYAAALARQPWLDQLPLVVDHVVPLRDGERWFLRDTSGHGLILDQRFAQTWHLIALSGGTPITVFGTWNGTHFWPLSLWLDQQFIQLEHNT